jgi:hypothetical protein
MNPYRVRIGVASFLFVLSFGNATALAQFASGIEGTVSDPTGAVVPDATVTVKNVDTGITQTRQTSESGYFRFVSLPAAHFTVTVSASGFETTVQERFWLQASEVKTVNISLEIGTTTTQVRVTAPPPPVETSMGRVSGVIHENQVRELPLVARNLFTLVSLVPGVTAVPTSVTQTAGDIFTVEYGPAMNAGGQRGNANNFMLDNSGSINNHAHGGWVNITPNAESVQEMSISANNFSAEYGRNASLIVNIITKQGTNDWHGSATWFHTDNVFQSRDIFSPNIPVFRRNEASWSLGGPILKGRTFVFGSMDILRSGVVSSGAATIATPSFISFMQQNHPNNISTDLWQRFAPVFQPVRNFTTAGGMTGTDCSKLSSPSDPITTPVGSMPCNSTITGEGDFAWTEPRNGIQWNARIDHTFNNSKDRLYGNFYRTTLQLRNFNIYPAFGYPYGNYSQYFKVNETHTFSPRVLNEAHFSYVRTHGEVKCDPCEIPGISVIGMTGFGNGWGPGTYVQNIFEWRDVVAFNHASHNLKAGINIQRYQDNDDLHRYRPENRRSRLSQCRVRRQ